MIVQKSSAAAVCFIISASLAFGKEPVIPILKSESSYKSGGKVVKVDVFTPVDQKTHAAVLVVHGSGGLNQIANYHEIAKFFAEHGYVALFPHYLDVSDVSSVQSLSEMNPAKFDLWKQSIRDAISFAGAQPGVDNSQLAIVSYSLGSFLSLEIVSEDTRVGAVAEFFGGSNLYKKEQASRMPPVLILHGDKDDSVPVARAYELEQVMQRLKIPYEIKIYPGEGHGFAGFSPEAQRNALDRSIAFFEKHLALPKTTSKRQRVQ